MTAALFFLLLSPLTAQTDLCLECHEVDVDRFAESVHGFLECAECHQGTDDMEIHPDEAPDTDCITCCANCHDGEVEEFTASIHGRMAAAGELQAQNCHACHGTIHELKPSSDPESPTNPLRMAETCGACHADPEMAERYDFHLVLPLEAYTSSVHARGVAAGAEAATCSDCHGSHDIFEARDVRSMVGHFRVPETCGQCHKAISAAYAESVHGQAAAHGIADSPVCTDCHGEHQILGPQDRESPVYATNVPKMTCGRCHGDIRLAAKFGLPEDKVPAYEDSYHGLASRSGLVTAANCASCHGVHDILPSTNPRSHTNTENLGETCGQCHPGAGSRFAIGPVHILPTQKEHTAVYWVRVIYLWLIVLTIGGMVLHNTFDLWRKLHNPPPRPGFAELEGRERMSFGFRVAHLLLMSSFTVLVYTGFALKYPEAWWTWPLSSWDAGSLWRGWIHRGAAVVMLLAAVVHAVHLVLDQRARRCIAGMLPVREDLVEIRERLAYFAGLRSHPPEAAWLGYPEKMEYLAVVWGTIVMAVTGFILWYQDLALRWLPTWVTDVSTVVHFYEAILASLAILVWHFYAVIFDPLVYPMDPAWLTGRSAPGRDLERRGPETYEPRTVAPKWPVSSD